MASVLMPLGLLIMMIVFIRDPKVLRVDLKAVNYFVTIMICFTFFRLAILSFLSSYGVDFSPILETFKYIEFWRLGLVFWEDAFFAIPIYYIIDRWKWSKFLALPAIATLSTVFAVGHLYQGLHVFLITLIVPYLFFYRYGKKYGFGTTMICHVLFDMFFLVALRLHPFII